MTSLTFYGGVKEIGGNKILLEDSDTRIFLDFGMSFSIANKYFSEFMQPRTCGCLCDFFEFGLLPDLEGLYRQDYLEHMKRPPEEKQFDGILLSHAHMDHAAYIHHLRPDIPIYGRPETLAILKAMEDTGSSGFIDYSNLYENFKIRPAKTAKSKCGFVKMRGEETRIPRTLTKIDKKFKINGLEIEPVQVNHSLPGATAYIIYASDATIVYTGDMRFHGKHGELTEKFIERAGEVKPDILITEGTRINEEKTETEKDVKEKICNAISKSENMVVASWPVRDTDRLESFFEATKDNERVLGISMKQAYLLDLLKQEGTDIPTKEDAGIRVYVPKSGWGIWKDDRYPYNIQLQDYKNWEKAFLDHKNAVTAEEIKKDEKSYVVRCDYFELNELLDLRPSDKSVYIRSVTEPFDDEMLIDYRKTKNWLNHFKLSPFYQIHCSGHMNRAGIERTVKTINAKTVIPIHTEKPGKFKQFAKIKLVKYGQRVEV